MTTDIQQQLHDVACMAAKAAARRFTDETPEAAAQVVAGAYLRALGRLQRSIQTVQAEWDFAATMEAGKRAGLDFGRSIGQTDFPLSAEGVCATPGFVNGQGASQAQSKGVARHGCADVAQVGQIPIGEQELGQ